MPPARFLDRSTPPHIATLVLTTGVAALSLNIFLPSLPSMARWFGVDYGLAQLTVSLYLVMTAVLQIFIGPVSDRFGRRPVMIGAIIVFCLATLGCLFAPTYGIFLACRMAQAVIAIGFALSRAVVRDMVGMEQAASLIGWVTMGMSIVPMLGPILGGALDEAFGWQASFVILLASGVALGVLVWADQGETAQTRPASFLAQAKDYPALLTSRRFWGFCLAAGLASGSFFAYLGGAPWVGTEVYGLDPSQLGIYFGAPAIGYLVGNGLSGRYSVRFGIHRMMMAGALSTTAGMALLTVLTVAGLAGPEVFFGLMVTVGLGNGLLLPSANAGMLSVRPQLAGSASGLGGAFIIGLGAVLSAFTGWVLHLGGGGLPLVLVMLVSSVAAIPCILWVQARARAVGAA